MGPRKHYGQWRSEKQRRAVMAAVRGAGAAGGVPAGMHPSTGSVYGVGRGKAFRKTSAERRAELETGHAGFGTRQSAKVSADTQAFLAAHDPTYRRSEE